MTDCNRSTVLTMFQIPDAAGDPLTRWSALLSLIFSIMSLTYGCIYIVQFNSMRSMYKASRWAEVRSMLSIFVSTLTYYLHRKRKRRRR